MAKRTLKQKTISGMIWVGFQKFGTLTITFLSNIVLARLLTPNDYGMIGMLTIFIAISNTFIDGGFGSALIQKTSPTQNDYVTVFYWNLTISILLYLLLYFTAPLIEAFYDGIHGLSNILRVQGIVLIINAINIVQFNQLRKKMQFKKLARINILSAIISVIFAIIAAFYGAGVWALVGQQISLSLCNSILLCISCRWSPKGKISIKSLKSLFNFGSFMMLSSLVNTIGNNVNGLIIGKLFSAATLGYFTQAKKVEDVTSMGLLTVIEQVSYPMLVEVKDERDRMKVILAKFNAAVLAITIPLLFTIFLMAAPLITFLFSEKWLPAAPILQILSIHGIFICMQGCNYIAIAAIGESKTLFSWTIIKRTLGLLWILIGYILYGFFGLLWGIVASSLTIVILNSYLIQKYIHYPIINQIKELLPILHITIIPFLIIVLFYKYCFLSEAYVFIYAFVYLVTYVILLYFSKNTAIIEIKLIISNVLEKTGIFKRKD